MPTPVGVCCLAPVCPLGQVGKLMQGTNQLVQEMMGLQQELAEGEALATSVQEQVSTLCLCKSEGGRHA